MLKFNLAIIYIFLFNSILNAQNVDTLKRIDQKSVMIYHGGIDLRNSESDYNEFNYISSVVINDENIKTTFQKALEDYNIKLKSVITKNQKMGLLKDKNYMVEKTNIIAYNDDLIKSLRKKLAARKYTDTSNQLFIDKLNSVEIEPVVKKILILTVASYGTETIYQKSYMDVVYRFKTPYDEIIDSITFIGSSEIHKYNLKNISSTILNDMANEIILKGFDEWGTSSKFYNILKVDEEKFSNTSLIKLTKTNFSKNIDEVSASTVIVKKDNDSHGSGFIISQDGYIITNYHVIASNKLNSIDLLKVILPNNEVLSAKVVRYSKFLDIALLKVDKKFNNAIELDATFKPELYSNVFAVGAPKSTALSQSIATGIISNERIINKKSILQLSININFGNSGGPIVNKDGKLGGVLVSKLIGRSTEGIAFAVPSYLLKEYLKLEY